MCKILMERRREKRDQVWEAFLDVDKVNVSWGYKDGVIQSSCDRPGQRGRFGTRTFISAENVARNKLIREVVKKFRAGFTIVSNSLDDSIREMIDAELSNISANCTEIDFSGPLGTNVAFSKPQNTYSRIVLDGLVKKGSITYTAKINGMCHIVTKDVFGKVWIQSRGKLDISNEKYPHLVKEFEALMPDSSILLTEFFMGRGYTKGDFKLMQSVSNSLPERAIEVQKEHGYARACIFRVPFWGGNNMELKRCGKWLAFLDEDIEQSIRENNLEYLETPFMLSNHTLDEVIEDAVKMGFEGWVAYNTSSLLGVKHVSFLGKAERPNCCWKVKPFFEDDFVALWEPFSDSVHCAKCGRTSNKFIQKCPICGVKTEHNGSFGTGRNSKRVGALSLFQYNQEGELIYISDVAAGLNDAQRVAIAKSSSFKKVAAVEYQDRGYLKNGDDSNSLLFPRFVTFREDKDCSECVNDRL